MNCSRCGTTLPAESRYCSQCGTQQTLGALEGEHRQLTIMFADLVGSTSLAQRLDPDRYGEVVRSYQAHVTGIVEARGGTVAQYLGDGLLVYFGYPHAHEDDVARAVQAGLDLLQSLESMNRNLGDARLQVRTSIHTGDVVVADVGDHRERLAIGMTVNVAARLNEQTPADTVVISNMTRRLIPQQFEFAPLGSLTLKGVSQPLDAYRVLRERPLATSGSPSAEAANLVGRQRELDILRACFDRAQRGEAQTVVISGEPGIGKTRLLRALREALATSGAHRWFEGRCSPRHVSSALYPVEQVLVQMLGLSQDAPPARRLEDLKLSLSRLGFEESSSLSLLATLLSIKSSDALPDRSPQRLREETLWLIGDLLLASPREQPVVLVVEDAQWLDPSSVEMLDQLAHRVAGSRMMVVISHRTGVHLHWAPPDNAISIPLARLSRTELRTIARGVSGGAALPADVLEHIVARADGVPLFAEELALGVLESGELERGERADRRRAPLAALGIPPTLQDSLMARLDRLPEGKYVAQIAATIGRTFSLQLLRAVASIEETSLQTGLEQLLDADLLRDTDEGNGAHFTFKHALIQEIAYQSLLRNDRRRVHARAAAVLVESQPELSEREPELVAQHYAGADQIQEAVSYWMRAAARALQRSAAAEAIQHYSSALELLESLAPSVQRDELELGLRLALGSAFITTRGYAAVPVEREFARATELCRRLKAETPRLFSAANGLWGYHLVRGDPDATEQLVVRQRDLAATSQGKSQLLMASHAAGVTAFYSGRFVEAVPLLEEATLRYEEALEVRRAKGDERPFRSPATSAPLYLGWCQLLMGRLERGLSQQERALELAERNSDAYVRVEAMTHLVASLHDRREPERAMDLSDRIIATSEECGFRWWLGIGKSARGWVRAQLGDAEGGIAEIHEGLAIFVESGHVPLVYRFSYLAEAYLVANRIADGLALISDVYARSSGRLDRFYDPEFERLRGEFLLRAGADPAMVEDVFRASARQAKRQSARLLELRSAISLARLQVRQRRAEEAYRQLLPLVEDFAEGRSSADLRDAGTLLDETRNA